MQVDLNEEDQRRHGQDHLKKNEGEWTNLGPG